MTNPDFIANFDSGAAMLRATARFLQGQQFPLLGMMPKMMSPRGCLKQCWCR
jgi:hypothetical protein